MKFTADFVDNDGSVSRVAEREAYDCPRCRTLHLDGEPDGGCGCLSICRHPLAHVLDELDRLADDYPRSVRALRRLIADNLLAIEILLEIGR